MTSTLKVRYILLVLLTTILLILSSQISYADVITPAIKIQEEDGSPSSIFGTIKFPDGSLTDNGDRTVSYGGINYFESTPTAATTAPHPSMYMSSDYLYVTVTDNSWKRIALENYAIVVTGSLLLEGGSNYLVLEGGTNKLSLE